MRAHRQVAAGPARAGLDGGKMLLRIDMDNPGTVTTLAACAEAVSELAAQHATAIIEPFMVKRVDHRAVNDLGTDAVIRSIAIASGLGTTSAYSWLKIPVVDDVERVTEASTLPTLLLGGEAGDRPDETFTRWQSYLMLSSELVTCIQEGVKLVVILVQPALRPARRT